MSMRPIIITLFCFLLTGCFSRYLVSDHEFEAQNHMELAAAKESSSNFQAAIKEYSIISEKYPDTRYYKTAVWRVALLNLHPNNPKMDYLDAQNWLKIYLKLPLSPEEKEIAVLYVAIIRQTNQILDEKKALLKIIEQQKKDKATLTELLKQARTKATQTKGKLKKLSTYEAEFLVLEKELSILRDKLQQMKEIDVQMHKTRKN